jgi:hypothetical protein
MIHGGSEVWDDVTEVVKRREKEKENFKRKRKRD